MRLVRPLAALALVLALVGAQCTDDDETRPARRSTTTTTEARDRPDDELDWRDCDGGECAELTVPLDYDDPDGPTTEVALIRQPATNPDERIGSLLVNPGGPGAPGVDFVADNGFLLFANLREHFDIVGFDPRGTGATLPIDCVDSLDSVLSRDYSPDSVDERDVLEDAIREYTAACEERYGEVLEHVSSQDTVRDMDRIREAVGDEKLTYLGFSYGTYLGALYADFFPDKVRALALDGAVDPELDALGTNLEQAAGFEASLNAFFEACAADRGCAFHNDGDPAAAFDALVAGIETDPPEADGRVLSPNEFELGVAEPLYQGELGWDMLAEALAEAADGDPSLMFELSDDYTERNEDGTHTGSILQPFWAIGCVDGAPIGDPEDLPPLEERFRAAAPRFGVSFLYSGLMCALWPADPEPSPNPLDAAGAPPILVIGTSGDPATPFQWAESLAGVLDSGVLLANEGEQHTAYLLSECATDLVDAYLIDLEVPEPGTSCGDETDTAG
ncbi:MAG TPA: alpha/beta hydrolase [Acidimicrobiia bacterium]